MRYYREVLVIMQFIMFSSFELYAQQDTFIPEMGITTGAFTNFPANENYLKENISVFYVAPYVRAGRHEFSAGLAFPLQTDALYFSDHKINPRPGAVAGYKFYVFNIYGRENMFVHYTFQYLRFEGSYELDYGSSHQLTPVTETDMYVNNVIGLGYNLFFDTNERFSFFYILDYAISQSGYHNDYNYSEWTTHYFWNRISTGFGLSFKLTALKKAAPK